MASTTATSAASAATETSCEIRRLGLIDYQQAYLLQRRTQHEVAEKILPSTLFLLEHPSVYTAGRRSRLNDYPKNEIKVLPVDRGGKITWHGPGQLVGYPIVRLIEPSKVVDFVRTLERALISTLKKFDIAATQICDNSGVWICDSSGDRKIAAIGIRVARGVVTHGFALNVNPDLSYFDKIIPCGIPDLVTTSMSAELGREITISQVLPIIEEELLREFEGLIG